MSHNLSSSSPVVVIGAGPAGLMAAEVLAEAGLAVQVYDAMPSAARKFLLAGKSGMNLTHAEPLTQLLQRYQGGGELLQAAIRDFDNQAIRQWCEALGIACFVGSSGRVFPVDMKAAPLLRAWVHRLRSQGVEFYMRHKWLGWQAQDIVLQQGEQQVVRPARALILACGGLSWARLGSDGSWRQPIQDLGAQIVPFAASNCGFVCDWSPYLREQHAGKPLNNVVLSVASAAGMESRQGQFVLTEYGVEGSLIYAMNAPIRAQLLSQAYADIFIDLLPGRDSVRLLNELAGGRGARSLSSFLKSKLGLSPQAIALLHEVAAPEQLNEVSTLASLLKRLPLRLHASRPIDEAISSAGGLSFSELDQGLMLRRKPGVFCAGEMLDWDAPTGGYLLTACFATGRLAARGVIDWLHREQLASAQPQS